MRKIVTCLFMFIFFLISCSQEHPVDIDTISIDSSEKKYVEIKQLLMNVREYPKEEKNLKYLEKALDLCEKDSSKAEIYFLIAETKLFIPLKGEFKNYQSSLDLQGAMDSIDKAISLNKKQAKYYGMKARIYRNINDFENAIVFYDKAIKLIPEKTSDSNRNLYHNKAFYIYNKAQFYFDKSECEKIIGKKKEALADIENAIKYAGEFDVNYNNYLTARIELKEELGFDIENILRDLDIIIDEDNKIKKYWAYLRKAVILEEHKEYAQALQAYKAALELSEKEPSVREYKAVIGVRDYKNSLQNIINLLEDKVNNK